MPQAPDRPHAPKSKQHDPLLQPFALGGLQLRNRIITTAHEPAYTDDGMPKDRYRLYHLARAKAGVAMVMTAGSASVSRDSPPAFGNILAWSDEVVPWMKQLADDCHEAGAAVMIQLSHLGRRTRWDRGDWLPMVAPGQEREPAHRQTPKLIEDWDIARIIKDYADACERMAAAGLDGVEIEAYGHLFDQFLSPLTNQMPPGAWDAENLQHRMQFGQDVLRACRERVGPDFLLGLRLAVDEVEPGGTTAAEGITMLQSYRDQGLIQFANVIRGRIHSDAALTDVIPVQGMRAAPHLDFAGEVRKATGLPILHAARIQDVATARHAIAAGLLDLVGMTRAHIADPAIVAKIAAGREDEIRPCVGATYCLDRIYQGGMALCIHNPATGREVEGLPHDIPPAEQAKSVVIIGAGPAGLEAARVAAARGHRVEIHELADQAGGQIRLLARSPRRAEMLGIVDWRLAECERLGVKFHFNSWLEADDVTALSPDVVIIATGGLPATLPKCAGAELAVNSWDILSGDVKPGQDVAIFDDAGDHAGLQVAEVLASQGAKVELITPDRMLAPEVMGMNLTPYLRQLQAHQVRFTLAERLTSVQREGNRISAQFSSDYRPDLFQNRSYDQLVLNTGTSPNAELYHALKPLSQNQGAVDYPALIALKPQPAGLGPQGFALYRIGDAVQARNIHAAVLDGLRFAMAI